jgi:hypothetical protein
MEMIADFFDNEQSDYFTGAITLNSAEDAKGSILMHLIFSMRQDRSFVESFMRSFKSQKLSCFKFVVLLAISTIFRFEQQALDSCKSFVYTMQSATDNAKKISWIPGKSLFIILAQ